MGKLVHFERRVGGPEPTRALGTADAEILIFTGVRYERGAPATPTKPSDTSGNKRKRG